MCENGKHVKFAKSFTYIGGFCDKCGKSVPTPGVQCQCGAEFHAEGIINYPCAKCFTLSISDNYICPHITAFYPCPYNIFSGCDNCLQ